MFSTLPLKATGAVLGMGALSVGGYGVYELSKNKDSPGLKKIKNDLKTQKLELLNVNVDDISSETLTSDQQKWKTKAEDTSKQTSLESFVGNNWNKTNPSSEEAKKSNANALKNKCKEEIKKQSESTSQDLSNIKEHCSIQITE